MRDHRHGTNETLGFNHFHDNYYFNYGGFMDGFQGYGGFNFSADVLYMNQSTWTQPEGAGYGLWCGTGYQNTCQGRGEAWIYQSGTMESANLHETFTLRSMVAASAWNVDAVWAANSYVYRNGALTLKASDQFTVSYYEHSFVEFGRLGAAKDFRNISAVTLQLIATGSYGSGGCGVYYVTSGVQLAIDNLKVHWNGKIPTGQGAGSGHMILPPHVQHHLHATPLPMVKTQHIAQQGANGAHSGSASHHDPGGWYHSQLLSLGHDSGLTWQFALPQPEHFGT